MKSGRHARIIEHLSSTSFSKVQTYVFRMCMRLRNVEGIEYIIVLGIGLKDFQMIHAAAYNECLMMILRPACCC